MARKNPHLKEPALVSTTTGKPPTVSREVSRSPEYISLYANDIQIHTSPWDLRFILGELADQVEGPHPSIKINQLGELRVSPQLAKKLVQLIAMQLTIYEQTFGKIPDVPIGIP